MADLFPIQFGRARTYAVDLSDGAQQGPWIPLFVLADENGNLLSQPQLVDDAAFTVGTSLIVPVGGVYRLTRDSVDDGHGGALAMTAKRALLSVLETPNGDALTDDTTDTLKVSIIAGQAGAAAGAGAVGAGVLRVTLASDDPLVAALRAEDAAHASGQLGMQLLAVRTDAPANRSDTDGDYEPLQVSAGRLWTDGVLRGNQVTLTNRSGTITAGGTARQLAASNAARRGFAVQNLSSGDLYISTEATAVVGQPSLKIGASQLYETPVHAVPTGAISIIGATTGQAFYAREW